MTTAIKSSDPQAITKLQAKIDRLQNLQDHMKAVNRIVNDKKLNDLGKVTKLQDVLGLSEDQGLRLLEPDWSGRCGFPSFSLTNNGATIRTAKKRLVEAQEMADTRAQVAEGQAPSVYPFDGGYVEIDFDDERVRIHHDTKPERDVIQGLKSEGWKWSRMNGGWQRMITQNTMSSVRRLTGVDCGGAV